MPRRLAVLVLVTTLVSLLGPRAISASPPSGVSVWIETDASVLELDPSTGAWRTAVAKASVPPRVAVYGEAGVVWTWDGSHLQVRRIDRGRSFVGSTADLGCREPELLATNEGNMISVCENYLSAWSPTGEMIWDWVPPASIDAATEGAASLWLAAGSRAFALEAESGIERQVMETGLSPARRLCWSDTENGVLWQSTGATFVVNAIAGAVERIGVARLERSTDCFESANPTEARDSRDNSTWRLEGHQVREISPTGELRRQFELPGEEPGRRIHLELRPWPLAPQKPIIPDGAAKVLDGSPAPALVASSTALASGEATMGGFFCFQESGGPVGGAATTILMPPYPQATTASDGSFVSLPFPLSSTRTVVAVGQFSSFAGSATGWLSGTATPGTNSVIGGCAWLEFACDATLTPTPFLASDLNGEVRAAVLFNDGSGEALYVGGTFTTARGIVVNLVAKWNGMAWSALGAGLSGNSNPSVDTLAVHDDGTGPHLYAGGKFTKSGTGSVSYVAKWTGSTWSQVGGSLGAQVTALLSADVGGSSSLYAGGAFTSANGIAFNHVARLSGSTWVALAGGLNGNVLALERYDDGSGPGLYAGGAFTAAGTLAANRIARWNGSAWSALGAGITGGKTVLVKALKTFTVSSGSALYVGGQFTNAGTNAINAIAKWASGSWSSVNGQSLAPSVSALGVFDDGTGPELFAGGSFTTVGNVLYNHIARLRGSSFGPVGTGVNNDVLAIASGSIAGQGQLVLGGKFTSVSGIASTRLARFWRPLSCTDTKRPKIDFIEPSSWNLPSARPAIRLGAFDLGSGLDLSTLRILQNNSPLAIQCSSSGYVIDCALGVDLAAGASSLQAEIRDHAGNLSESESIPVTVPESIPPVIAIGAPSDGSSVATLRPTFSIAYSDVGSGIDLESFTLSIDGLSMDFDCDKTASEASCIPRRDLHSGPNTARAGIRDFQGNVASPGVSNFTVTVPSNETAIVGSVRFEDGSPANGAVVFIDENPSLFATVSSDGTFTLSNLEVLDSQPVNFVARLVRPDATYLGFAPAVSPVLGGVTNIGQLELKRDCESFFEPVQWAPTLQTQGEITSLARALSPAGEVTLFAGATTVGGVRLRGAIGLWDEVAVRAAGGGLTGGGSRVVEVSDGVRRRVYGLAEATGEVAEWNGLDWTHVGPPIGVPISTVAWADLGSGPELFAAGSGLFRWNGATWKALGGPTSIRTLTVFEGRLFVGGAANAQWWDGTSWSSFVYSIKDVYDSATFAGNLHLVGTFSSWGYGYVGWNDAQLFNKGAGPGCGYFKNRTIADDGSTVPIDGELFAVEAFRDGAREQLVVGGDFASACVSKSASQLTGYVLPYTNVNLGTGVDAPPVRAIASGYYRGAPAAFVAGGFTTAGGATSELLTVWQRSPRWGDCDTRGVPPRITIVDPPAGTTRHVSVVVRGNVDEPASMWVDGTALSVNADHTFEFASGELSEGPNTYLFRALDRSGRESTLDYTLVRDSVPPAIFLTSPASGARVYSAQPKIVFALSDDGSGIDAASLRVTIDGLAAPLSCLPRTEAAICSPVAPLIDGVYTLRALVRDLAGNEAVAAPITIVVDTAGGANGTTVVGRVVFDSGSPAAASTVKVLGLAGVSATTQADGSFSLGLSGLTSDRRIQVVVQNYSGGQVRTALSTPTIPAIGGITGVGTLTLHLACDLEITPGIFGKRPGLDGPVYAAAVYDDGSGPALYLGGYAILAPPGLPFRNMARWDGEQFQPLQGGEPGTAPVRALAVFDDGTGPQLYAGGSFTYVGTQPVNGIARWNGTSWTGLGQGVQWESRVVYQTDTCSVGSGSVYALDVFDDGSGPALFVGGHFNHVNGNGGADNVARWRASGWDGLGSPVSCYPIGIGSIAPKVFALAHADLGSGPQLFAAGTFDSIGGVAAKNIARRTSNSWAALDDGVRRIVADGTEDTAMVNALAIYDSGSGPELIAAGLFNRVGSGAIKTSSIARWNGSRWATLGSGLETYYSSLTSQAGIQALAVHDSGHGPELFAVGKFTGQARTTFGTLARWNGVTWHAAGTSPSEASEGGMLLYSWDDELVVGGDFESAGGAFAWRVARFDGVDWRPFGDGLDNDVRALVTFDDGTGSALYVGGLFKSGGGKLLNGIARWDGATFKPLGTGIDGSVYALEVFDDGRGPALYVGGHFFSAGSISTRAIARWDGASWEALGAGFPSPYGTAFVRALKAYDDGSGPALFVGGTFSEVGGLQALNVARWKGSSWQLAGAGLTSGVSSFATAASGGTTSLYAGGYFYAQAGTGNPSRVARWSGQDWLAVGSGPSGNILAVAPWTAGSLLAGGDYPSLAQRWNGATWSTIAGTTGSSPSSANGIALWDDGRGVAAYFGGSFASLGSSSGNRVARWNGSAWSGIGSGISSGNVAAFASAEESTGSALYLGGSFTAVDGIGSGNLARWSRPLVCSDTAGPVISILEPAATGWTVDPRPRVRATIVDARSAVDPLSIALKLDGAPLAADCNLDGSSLDCWPRDAMPNGTHSLTVEARDIVGNPGSASRMLQVDNLAPQVEFFDPLPGATLTTSSPLLRFRFVDAGSSVDPATIVIRVESASSIGFSCTYSASGGECAAAAPVADGSFELKVAVGDLAGNSTLDAAATFVVDTLAPTVSIAAPAPGSTAFAAVDALVVEVQEAGSGLDMGSTVAALDASPVALACAPGDLGLDCSLPVAVYSGTHTLSVSVADRVGRRSNTAASTFTVAIDTTPPALSFAFPATGASFDPQVNLFQLSWSDAGAGVDSASLVVTANGALVGTECSPVAGGTACRIVQRLRGAVTLAATVSDLAGLRSVPATLSIVVPSLVADFTPPEISIDEPSASGFSNRSPLAIRGHLSEPATLTLDLASVAVASDLSFRLDRPLVEGANSMLLEAADPSGNVGRLTLEVELDTTAPAGLDDALLGVADSQAGVALFQGAAGCVLSGESGLRVLARVRTTGAETMAEVASDRSFAGAISGLPGDEVEFRVVDLAGNESSAQVRTLAGSDPVSPIPGGVGAALGSAFCRRYSFLWSGTSPVQFGVAADALDCRRAAVLHGRVLAADGTPIEGARVSAPEQPAVGTTFSRANGEFDLAVNGGGAVVVLIEAAGRVAVERLAEPAWAEVRTVEDVRLTALDAAAPTIVLAGAPILQTARGSVASDSAGQRQSTILVPAGVVATARRTNGSTIELQALTLHLTELTVGEQLAQRLPGPLPPGVDPTFVVDFTVDEAVAAGASTVLFSQPLPLLVDNFLGIPAGTRVSAAAWERADSHWASVPDGRVLGVLAESGGLALLDVDGSGTPATQEALSALGITDAERRTIASLYAPGQSLMRAQVTHFSSYYLGFPLLRVAEATGPAPDLPLPTVKDDRKTEGAALGAFGGLVDGENRILREAIPIAGTPFTLVYASDRTPGRKAGYRLSVPLSGATLPAGLSRIELSVETAGRVVERSFAPAPNLQTTVEWSGLDALDRPVNGPARWTAEVAYVYEGALGAPASGDHSFALPSGRRLEAIAARGEVRSVRVASGSYTPFDARERFGFGGWGLDVQHAVDPLSATVFYGSGDARRLSDGPQVAKVLVRVAGNGVPGPSGDGGIARDAQLAAPTGLAFTASGALLVADSGNCRIRRIERDGTISTIAGTDCSDADPASTEIGDGGLATAAKLLWPSKAVATRDGTIYVADTGHRRVRRIDHNGRITTLFGNGAQGCSGGALEGPQDLVVDGQGTLFVLTDDETPQDDDGFDTCDGVWQAVAGTGLERIAEKWSTGTPLFGGEGLALRPDGALVLSQTQCVQEIPADRQGGLETSWLVGGRCHYYSGGEPFFAGDGEVAGWDPTRFFGPGDLSLGPDGTIYLADSLNSRIRSISPDRRVRTFAGGGAALPTSDGVPATAAALGYPAGIAVSPAGTAIYFSDSLRHAIWKIANPAPFGDDEIVVPAADGSVIDVFDGDGNHLRTEDGTTRRTVMIFRYEQYPAASPEQPPRKLVTEIEDAFGNVVTIERTGDGTPLAIASPFGQRTTLGVDGAGYLAEISRPGLESIEAVQPTHAADGLLTSLRDPNGGIYEYEWSADGELERIDVPGAGVLNLDETTSQDGRAIDFASALGRTSATKVSFDVAGLGLTATEIGSDGLQSASRTALDGSVAWSAPRGLEGTAKVAGHAVFGPLAQELSSSTTTIQGRQVLAVNHSTPILLTNASDPLQTLLRTDEVDVNGRTSTVTYDSAANEVRTTSPEGRQTTSHLDVFGRVTQLDLPGLESTRTSYDGRGRLERVEQGSGPSLRQVGYGYSATTGYLETVTDPLGRTVRFERDPVGRVTKQILPDLREIGFSYDPNGNVTQVTPPTRPGHLFGYTPIDQVDTYTPPDAGFSPRATSYAYNADGQLTTVTRPDGVQLLYDYEPATGRLASVTLPTGAIGLAYDSEGRVGTVSSPGGVTATFDYDGPLLTSLQTAGPVPGTVAFGYDGDLRLASQSINGEAPVAFTYDDDDLLTQAGALSLDRDPATGFLLGTTLGITSDARSFTSFGELDTFSASVGGSLRFTVDLDRDAAGRILKKTETIAGVTSVWEYRYELNRGWLVEVKKDGTVVESYGYDGNGNRTSTVDFWGSANGTYDAQDRLLGFGSKSYTYAANGELLTKSEGSETTTYTYDARGALLEIDLPSGIQIEYVADTSGRRIGKKVNGTLVEGWIYAGGLAPVAETDGAGSVTTTYVYGTRVNVPEYFTRGGNTYRIVTDHLGSVRLVIDATDGSIAQRLDYDAYGRIILDNNPGFQPFGFAGGLYDVQSGLTRFGARDYDPEIGRWTSKDPIGFAGGSAGLYEYCGNDPVNGIDPSGLLTLPWELLDLWSYQQSSAEFSRAVSAFAARPSWSGALSVGTSLITALADGASLVLPVVPAVGGLAQTGVRHGGGVLSVLHNGPGAFVEVAESMSAKAASYQARATGTAPGFGYVVGGVKFDGFANGVLLDAKANYSQFVRDGQFVPWFSGADTLVSQAQRQLSVAGMTPVQWRFLEEEAAAATTSLLHLRGISGIEIIHLP